MNRSHTFATLTALGVLAAAGSLAVPAVASAGQPSAAALHANVYYNLHELSTERGTHALYLRIVRAAAEVCPGGDSQYADVVAASQECRQRAIAHAITQIGNERLAALDAQIAPYRG